MAAALAAAENRTIAARGALEPIRVIFVDMPRLVREIVTQAVESQEDMVVVAAVETPEDVLPVLDRQQSRVVVVDGAIDERVVTRLLRRTDSGAVLTLSAAGDGGDLFEHVWLDEASPTRIVHAIRTAASHADGDPA